MHTPAPVVTHFPDTEAMSVVAAAELVGIVHERVQAQGVCSLVLAGGNTPRMVYALLAGERYIDSLPWESIHLFWGDERFVALDDERSNYRMVHESLLDRVAIPDGNVHAVDTSLSTASASAAEYESRIRAFFEMRRIEPSFDLALLGIGADGHTASLFPGDNALTERGRLVLPVNAPSGILPLVRITLTPPAFTTARHVLFMAAMSGKEAVLHALEQGSDVYPAGLIHGRLTTRLLIADHS